MLTTIELQKLREQEDYTLYPDLNSDDWYYKQEWHRLKRAIHKQRLLNKLIKEIYEEAGIFSFRDMEMAIANLARIESTKLKGESKEIWWRRYLGIRYKGLLRPYRILGRKK